MYTCMHLEPFSINLGGGPRVVVSTAAFPARVRGFGSRSRRFERTKCFFPIHVWNSILWGSLRDREVACSASDRLCSDGLLFRRCYVWKVLCSEGPVFRRSLSLFRSYVRTLFHLSVSGIKHFFISVHFAFLFYFLHNSIIHFFSGYTRMSSEDPTFLELQIS